MQKLFIFGLGYSSQAIAKLAMQQGYAVSGTVRSLEKAEMLRAQGIDAITFVEFNNTHLGGVTHILSSIPPQQGVDVVVGYVSEGGWLGYLSTTGVYGDHAGEWVDETSELRPYSDRLNARVAAEKAWLDKGGHIFRLAGIYGSGRNVLEDILTGEARRIKKPGQVFSRIHVEDIAQTVVASMATPEYKTVYNVCDDEPAPAHEVVAYGCELLGVEPPPLVPFEQAGLSAMGQEFYAANRRVSNQRIKDNLGINLYYPNYKLGLQALARSLQNR